MARHRQTVRLPVHDHLLAVGFYLVAGWMALNIAEGLLAHPAQLTVWTGITGLVAVALLAVLMASMTRPRPTVPTTAAAMCARAWSLVPRRAAGLALVGAALSGIEGTGVCGVLAYFLVAGELWGDVFWHAYRRV